MPSDSSYVVGMGVTMNIINYAGPIMIVCAVFANFAHIMCTVQDMSTRDR